MKRDLLVGHDAEVATFVAALAPLERPVFAPGYSAIGVLDDRCRLIFGVVFSDYMPHWGTCQLSAAGISSFALSTGIVAALQGYAFRQLACTRVWARTSVKNRRAARLLKHIGFKPEGAAADYYGPGHAAENWRMLKREWLQRCELKAAA